MKIAMSATRPVTAGIEQHLFEFNALIKAMTPWVAKQKSTKDDAEFDAFYEATLKPGAIAKVIKHLLKENFKPTRKGYKKGKVRVELSPGTIYFNIEGFGE